MGTLYHRQKSVFGLVVANMVLYALFLLMDGWGEAVYQVLPYGPDKLFFHSEALSPVLKYAAICVCFAIAQAVMLRSSNARDARLQVVILLFTVVADYFLLFGDDLRNLSEDAAFSLGMAVFLGAHACAVLRYGGRPAFRKMLIATGIAAGATAGVLLAAGEWESIIYRHSDGLADDFYEFIGDFTYYLETFAFAIFLIAYIMLIIAATVCAFRRRQARVNNVLSRLGMCLFLCCDVNVLLMNIRDEQIAQAALGHAGPPTIPALTGVLIWAFYLPAQTMLALSAGDYEAIHRNEPRWIASSLRSSQ
jgi:hypothetical protein